MTYDDSENSNAPDRPHVPDVTDADMEALERYLDDAMPPAEAEAFQLRLARDGALADALAAARAMRALRQAAWESMEPAHADADQFAAAVLVGARRRERWERVWQIGRAVTAAAACIALGFAAGWMGRGEAGPIAAERAPARPEPVALRVPAMDGADGFQVALADEAGNVLAVQRFARLEEAQEFAADLGRWQVRQQEVQQGDLVLVADQF